MSVIGVGAKSQSMVQSLVDMRAQQFVNVARLYVATAGGWTGSAEVAAR